MVTLVVVCACLYLFALPAITAAPQKYWNILVVGWIILGVVLTFVCIGAVS